VKRRLRIGFSETPIPLSLRDIPLSQGGLVKILHESLHLCRLSTSYDAFEYDIQDSEELIVKSEKYRRSIYFYPKNEIKIIPERMIHAPRKRCRRFFSRKNHPPRTTAKSADADLNALVYGAITSDTIYICER
jgi:hypothetical protein